MSDDMILARKKIEFLERQLSEAESRYDKMAIEAFKYRNEARKYEYAIRDHQRACLKNPTALHVANDFLWGKL